MKKKQTNSISFVCDTGEVMKISSNGKFFALGKEIKDTEGVYKKFVEFIKKNVPN